MTATSIFRLIIENSIEASWRGESLYLWLDHYSIRGFCELANSYLSDGGTECQLLQSGCICIDIVPVCDYYGIDPVEVCLKEEIQ